jgi:excisionase family DNA binding protein
MSKILTRILSYHSPDSSDVVVDDIVIAAKQFRRPRREDMDNAKLALRPQQAAEALGISRAKLYELLNSGALPSVRLGGVRVIPVDALRKLIE